MDIDITLLNLDTGLLIALTAIALGWFLSLSIYEEIKKRKYCKKEMLDSIQRVARVKKLSGRL